MNCSREQCMHSIRVKAINLICDLWYISFYNLFTKKGNFLLNTKWVHKYCTLTHVTCNIVHYHCYYLKASTVILGPLNVTKPNDSKVPKIELAWGLLGNIAPTPPPDSSIG